MRDRSPCTGSRRRPPLSPACSASTSTARRAHTSGRGAHLRNLRRLAVGPFPVDEAAPIESVTLESVVPPPEALRGMPSVTVDAVRRVDVGHGKVLAREDLGVAGAYDGPWAVLDEDGTLLGVYEAVPGGDRCKPAVVMI
jgi:tRNA pseudouridine55 synthase